MSYASIDDLQAGWRVLVGSEASIASELLDRASNIIEQEYHDAGISKVGLTPLQLVNARTVCCDMVRNAMVDARAMASSVLGEVVDSAIWEKPAVGGGLYITESQRRMLGIRRTRAGLFGVNHGKRRTEMERC